MSEDPELRLLEQRKLAEMKRRAKPAPLPARAKTDREVLESSFYDRADEVLEAAYSYYPKQTEQLVKELAKVISDGKFTGKISGGELYSIFRQVGLRFQLKTTFKVQEKGNLIDLSEKLKMKSGD